MLENETPVKGGHNYSLDNIAGYYISTENYNIFWPYETVRFLASRSPVYDKYWGYHYDMLFNDTKKLGMLGIVLLGIEINAK